MKNNGDKSPPQTCVESHTVDFPHDSQAGNEDV
jgi:hypothetical protein